MKNKVNQTKIAACVPKSGESSWNYGMRVWNMGQRFPMRSDWEVVKVEAMYIANKCKLEQNQQLAEELLATSGTLTHRGSSRFWDAMNPLLLMLIREDMRGVFGDKNAVSDLRVQLGTHFVIIFKSG
jgi:hypothetical protein